MLDLSVGFQTRTAFHSIVASIFLSCPPFVDIDFNGQGRLFRTYRATDPVIWPTAVMSYGQNKYPSLSIE